MEKQSRLSLLLLIVTLLICMLLMSVSFVILHQTSEHSATATRLLETLDLHQNTSHPPPTEMPNDSPSNNDMTVDADILYDVFYLREANGKIGIFTEQGYLVRMLSVDIETLPEKDRAAISEGICVTSWRELISLIEDYES